MQVLTDEVLVLSSGCEQGVTRAVAREQSGRLGDGVVVGTPHEFDGVTDSCINGERNVTQNTLSRSNNDGVGSTSAVARGVGSRWLVAAGRRAISSNAFYWP